MRLTTRHLATAILFTALFAIATWAAVGPESFWQLRAGKWMLDNGRLINFDVFSHTYLNALWLNPSWLSEVVMAVIFQTTGFAGLKLATAAVVWLAFMFVYIAGRGGAYLRAYVLMAAALTSAMYWSVQSHSVSMLMTAVFGFILIQFRAHGVNRLWLLPVLMILWVNMDGGFAVGLVILLATIAGETLKWIFNRSDIHARTHIIWLAVTCLLCVTAVIVNPSGFQMLAYPFRVTSIDLLQNFNQGWQSPNFHERIAQFFIVFWLATLGAVGFSGKRLDPVDFLLLTIFTALALIARQNIALFVVIVSPILMLHADGVIGALQTRWQRLKSDEPFRSPGFTTLIINWLLLIVVFAACLIKISYQLSPVAIENSIAITQPVGAAAYLKTHPVQGRLFNSYNYGGYLIWELYPDTPVFMDGRTGLFSDEFISEAFAVLSNGTGWRELFSRYDVGAVLVDVNAPLANTLLQETNWIEQYRDHSSIVIININD
jgi:hypothetical protein